MDYIYTNINPKAIKSNKDKWKKHIHKLGLDVNFKKMTSKV